MGQRGGNGNFMLAHLFIDRPASGDMESLGVEGVRVGLRDEFSF
jgi:hypothetical protein